MPVKIKDELLQIPGVGKSIAHDLHLLGIHKIEDLRGRDPYVMFDESNRLAGCIQDRCLLYVFKSSIYYAETPLEDHDPEKVKWWNWKDVKSQ